MSAWLKWLPFHCVFTINSRAVWQQQPVLRCLSGGLASRSVWPTNVGVRTRLTSVVILITKKLFLALYRIFIHVLHAVLLQPTQLGKTSCSWAVIRRGQPSDILCGAESLWELHCCVYVSIYELSFGFVHLLFLSLPLFLFHFLSISFSPLLI